MKKCQNDEKIITKWEHWPMWGEEVFFFGLFTGFPLFLVFKMLHWICASPTAVVKNVACPRADALAWSILGVDVPSFGWPGIFASPPRPADHGVLNCAEFMLNIIMNLLDETDLMSTARIITGPILWVNASNNCSAICRRCSPWTWLKNGKYGFNN